MFDRTAIFILCHQNLFLPMKKYYVHDGQDQSGPFDVHILKENKIRKDTPIWFEGLNDWTRAVKIDELKEFILPIPPPYKQAPPSLTSESKKVASLDLTYLKLLLFQ